MTEYIEREAVIEKNHGGVAYIDDIKNIPAADVATVRHGRWVNKGGYLVWCSECNKHNKTEKTHYCPNCGAKMDGER